MKEHNGSKEIKLQNFDICIERMKAHMVADELVRGVGFEDGKGCAVGCTFDEYDHYLFQNLLGVPEWMARILDSIFEGMDLEKSKTFPLLFLEASKAAVEREADLDQIESPFMFCILEDTLNNFDKVKFADVAKCVNDVIDLYKSCETDLRKFDAAARASWAAADAAHDNRWNRPCINGMLT